MTTTAGEPPRIVAAAPGAPFDPLTWSGSSRALLTALEAKGALAGAVDGWPKALARIEQAASFSPDRARWRQRYYAGSAPLAPLLRRGLAALTARRLGAVDARPDAVLQIGAWWQLVGQDAVRPRLRTSYHDGNLAVSLSRTDAALNSTQKEIRRALAFERRVYDGLDLIMPMSEWLRGSFIEDFDQSPDKVVAVGAGANLERLPDPPERDFSRLKVLFVGREWERKGGPDVLAAFRRVRERRPDAELWVVSAGRPQGEADGVRSFGRILRSEEAGEREIQRLYREATVFVLPSIYEPFGIAFLEAMAYRLPCVGSDACAIPEMVQDGRTGFLVPARDPDALAERILAIADDPDRARAMGEAGHRAMAERYTWDAVADRMIAAVNTRLGRLG